MLPTFARYLRQLLRPTRLLQPDSMSYETRSRVKEISPLPETYSPEYHTATPPCVYFHTHTPGWWTTLLRLFRTWFLFWPEWIRRISTVELLRSAWWLGPADWSLFMRGFFFSCKDQCFFFLVIFLLILFSILRISIQFCGWLGKEDLSWLVSSQGLFSRRLCCPDPTRQWEATCFCSKNSGVF